MILTFTRQSSPESNGYSGERLINGFLRPAQTISQGIICGRSGLSLHRSYSNVRALSRIGGALYVIAAGRVWRDGATPVLVGSVPDDTATAVASNGRAFAIVAGGAYHLCNGTTTIQYDTGAITSPRDVAFQDGYFIVTGSSGDRDDAFTISALDDGTTFNALDFAFAEASPDEIVGVIADHNEVWLFGKDSIEVFRNSGAQDFPFERNAGAKLERGCLDGRTIAKEDNGVFWIGQDRVAYRSNGVAPMVISTREVDEALEGGTITGGFTFRDRGHKFYAVSVEGRPTLCYDLTTQLWSERSTGLDYGPWACTGVLDLDGAQYFTADIGVLTQSADLFTDLGAEMALEAVSVPIVQGNKRFRVPRAELRMDGGALDIGRDPQVMMQTTKDGENWSPEKWRPLGRLGNYGRKARWNGLGQFEFFQARIRITDPVARDIYGVTLG